MTRWNKGSEVIERLLDARQLEQVPADADTVTALLTSAGRHVNSATTTAADDPEGALALAYDAARKSATALLAHQGLRPTSSGGHIVIVEAMTAQFPGVAGLKSIDRIRRRRNQAEYPDPQRYDPITADEVDDAIGSARRCATPWTNSRVRSRDGSNNVRSRPCSSCGTPLSGRAGAVVKCPSCGTKQKLL